MDIENVIAIVLFILPGFFTFFWNEHLSSSKSIEQKTELEKSTEILLFAIPTVYIALVIMKCFGYKIDGFQSLENASKHFNFITFYFLISIPISFICSFFWVTFFRNWLSLIINKHRVTYKKGSITSLSVWEETLNLGNNRIAFVYKIGEAEKGEWGILESGNKPSDPNREISLIGTIEVEKIDKSRLTEERTYINTLSQVVIKTYVYNN